MTKTLATLALLAAGAFCQANGIILKSGDKLAFLGDSITQGGGDQPGGYCQLVIRGLAANGVQVQPVYAGIMAHESDEMLGRVDRDVIAKKPTHMTLSCGVNDVMHGCGGDGKGVSLEDYKKNITALLDKVQAAGIKPIVLTSTMIGEDQRNPNNQKLVAYNDFLKALAKERAYPLADLNARMQEAVEKAKAANAPHLSPKLFITSDNVHMSPPGDQMMAEGVLRCLGLSDAQMELAKASWRDIPAAYRLYLTPIMVSTKDYARLATLAASEHLSIKEHIDRVLRKAIQAELDK